MATGSMVLGEEEAPLSCGNPERELKDYGSLSVVLPGAKGSFIPKGDSGSLSHPLHSSMPYNIIKFCK